MTAGDQGHAVRELFGTDADAYDARHYSATFRTYIADRQRLVARLFRALALPAGARVLDIACGPGHFLHLAASCGTAPFGIDNSPDMLRASATRMGDAARLARGDATLLPFASGTFDAVNCSGLIEYIQDPAPIFREIHRILKPGGVTMVSSTNSLSPALVLTPVLDGVRRSPFLKRVIRGLRLPFDEMSLRERKFRFWFHTPGQLRALAVGTGFANVELRYYHLQFVPHPLDRVAPWLATACVAVTDRLLGVPLLRGLSEGLLVVGRRPAAPS